MRVIKAIVLFFALCLGQLSAHASEVVPVQSDCHGKAVVLVGGFGDDWRYFEPWLEELRESSGCVFGFSHDHRRKTMTEGAAELATELEQLHYLGFQELTVLAHSMGGLVAKTALHRLGEQPLAASLKVELRAYGTPWGGFFWANFARWVPGSQAITTLLGFPMSAEIGSTSDFMKALQQPLPANMTLIVHNSNTDEVAQPQTQAAKEQFLSVLSQANAVHTYDDIGHSDFVLKLHASL